MEATMVDPRSQKRRDRARGKREAGIRRTNSEQTTNLHWVKDTVALKVMQRMGWEEGKGLGSQEQGRTKNLQLNSQFNTRGLGAAYDGSNTWNPVTDDYNRILSNLSKAFAKPAAKEVVEETTEEVEVAPSASRPNIRSLHRYHKVARAKSVRNYSDSDLAAIIGVAEDPNNKHKKEEELIKMDPRLAAQEQACRQLHKGKAAAEEEEEGQEEQDEEKVSIGLQTTTATLSISDYFRNMKGTKSSNKKSISTDDEEAESTGFGLDGGFVDPMAAFMSLGAKEESEDNGTPSNKRKREGLNSNGNQAKPKSKPNQPIKFQAASNTEHSYDDYHDDGNQNYDNSYDDPYQEEHAGDEYNNGDNYQYNNYNNANYNYNNNYSQSKRRKGISY